MINPLVSIIVPVNRFNKNLDECIRHCLEIDYPNYEIIVLPDEESADSNGNVRIIPTGKAGPALKRNKGVNEAKGEIIAFIDDDTYPEKNWLMNAVRNFADDTVAAVGGPAVTPENDSPRQKASGAVYESLFGGGVYRYRYIPQKRMYVDDYPSCNLIVRKDVFNRLGGFRTNFWPGEDTALCLDIIHKLGRKIVYDPDALIYHHRRTLFREHLRQVKAYALHRGYFAKKFPKTSLKISYFLPSIFTVFLFFGWIVSYKMYFLVILPYLFLIYISAIRFKKIRSLTFFGIIATHITYGIWFVIGLLSKRLKEE